MGHGHGHPRFRHPSPAQAAAKASLRSMLTPGTTPAAHQGRGQAFGWQLHPLAQMGGFAARDGMYRK